MIDRMKRTDYIETREDIISNIETLYSYLHGEKNAKIYLSKLLRAHPSPLLKSLDGDWNEWVRMNDEELKLMNIKILR